MKTLPEISVLSECLPYLEINAPFTDPFGDNVINKASTLVKSDRFNTATLCNRLMKVSLRG
jgi:hypothetical protein